eukprot:2171247-Rhodomonas_salina.2
MDAVAGPSAKCVMIVRRSRDVVVQKKSQAIRAGRRTALIPSVVTWLPPIANIPEGLRIAGFQHSQKTEQLGERAKAEKKDGQERQGAKVDKQNADADADADEEEDEDEDEDDADYEAEEEDDEEKDDEDEDDDEEGESTNQTWSLETGDARDDSDETNEDDDDAEDEESDDDELSYEELSLIDGVVTREEEDAVPFRYAPRCSRCFQM